MLQSRLSDGCRSEPNRESWAILLHCARPPSNSISYGPVLLSESRRRVWGARQRRQYRSPQWSLFSVLNRYPLETFGALSTPMLRPKLKHGEKKDFTMRLRECGETDYDTFMTLAELC